MFFFFFKQKTAYEMCGRDWSSDVCSSDLGEREVDDLVGRLRVLTDDGVAFSRDDGEAIAGGEIGRASCRERV